MTAQAVLKQAVEQYRDDVRPTRLDRAIERVAPSWGKRRLHSRKAMARDRALTSLAAGCDFGIRSTIGGRAYDAARYDRLYDDWDRNLYSADGAGLGAQGSMLARSRGAMRNTWAGKSIAEAYVRHVIGTGMKPRATVENAPELNRALDRNYKAWASRPQLCDAERRKGMTGIQRLAAREFVTAGEALVVWSLDPTRTNISPLVLQTAEPEQLDTTRLWAETEDGRNEVRNGIEIDERGAAVAYWMFLKGHPLDSWRGNTAERIPAHRVFHLVDPTRVRQTHGESVLAPVLQGIQNLDRYIEYMMVRTQMEAAIGGAVEDSMPEAAPFPGFPSTEDVKTNDDGALEFSMEPGMMPVLPRGKTIKFNTPQSPGNLFDPFVKSMVAQIAAGANLDYATVMRDFTQGSYSAQRQGLVEMYGMTDSIQMLFVELFLAPLWDLFVRFEIASGRVPATMADFQADPFGLAASQWAPPPKRWIDPDKEVKATVTAIENRLLTHAEADRQQGRDWREQFEQTAEEERFADRLGITLPTAGEAAAPQSDGGSSPGEDEGEEEGNQQTNGELQWPRSSRFTPSETSRLNGQSSSAGM